MKTSKSPKVELMLPPLQHHPKCPLLAMQVLFTATLQHMLPGRSCDLKSQSHDQLEHLRHFVMHVAPPIAGDQTF